MESSKNFGALSPDSLSSESSNETMATWLADHSVQVPNTTVLPLITVSYQPVLLIRIPIDFVPLDFVGQKWPTKKIKGEEIYCLLDVLFRGMEASSVAWTTTSFMED
jgi:hypothetical protein